MSLSNLFIPFDAYERNKKISTLLGSDGSVLDVGGGATGIKLFTDNKVTIVDLEVGDIRKDARKLKLPGGSYGVVICVDTLEHIPMSDRRSFVSKLIGIAKDRVIISAPYGSKLHINAEADLLKKFKKQGKNDFFLSQHVEYGLPKPSEAKVSKHRSKTFYSGDFRVSNLLFSFQSFETKILLVDKLLLVVRKLMNFLLNIFMYPIWFYSGEREHANRFYVVIDKT